MVGEDGAAIGDAGGQAAKRCRQSVRGVESEATGFEGGDPEARSCRGVQRDETGLGAEDRPAGPEDGLRRVGEDTVLQHRARCRQQRRHLTTATARPVLRFRRLLHWTLQTLPLPSRRESGATARPLAAERRPVRVAVHRQ